MKIDDSSKYRWDDDGGARRWAPRRPVGRPRRRVTRRDLWGVALGVAAVAFMTLVVILGMEHFGPVR